MKPPASDPTAFGPDEIDPLDLEALHDLLDERLDAAASMALRARLEREPVLRAAWRELCELRELLREEWSDETPTPLDPRALADRVLDRARELAPVAAASAPAIVPAAAPVTHRAPWFRFGLSFVAAASVCAAAIWLASLPQESASGVYSAKVEEPAEELVIEEQEGEGRSFADPLGPPGPAKGDPSSSGEIYLLEQGRPKMRVDAPSAEPSPASAAPAAGAESEPGRFSDRNGTPVREPEPDSSGREDRAVEPSAELDRDVAFGGLPREAEVPLSLGAGAAPRSGGGGGRGVPVPGAKNEAPAEQPGSTLGWQDSAGEALRLALGSLLQGEVAPGSAAPAAPAAPQALREVPEVEELAAAEGDVQVPEPIENRSGAWLEDAARSLVRQLDVDFRGLPGSGTDDKSAGAELGDVRLRQEVGAAKSKEAVVSVAVADPLWVRLEQRWSETDPGAELAKRDAGVSLSRSIGHGIVGGQGRRPEAEPVLVLHFRQLAPAQIANATSALRSRGLVEEGGGLLLQDALRFRSVLSPVETAANSPSVFVGWVDLTASLETEPAPAQSFGFAVPTPSTAEYSHRWVLFEELERAIAAAQKTEERARETASDPVPPTGVSVASKDAASPKPGDADRSTPGAAVAPDKSRDIERGAPPVPAEAKKLGASPGGSAGPAMATGSGSAPAVERAPTSNPGPPASPQPAPPRAVRVLAILEPKRGG
ncbi:MAG: hypothetical protein JNM84_10400 [Planctomycetes bacterium]|nr:hypothetical protein [Planctomycetota bacterium]